MLRPSSLGRGHDGEGRCILGGDPGWSRRADDQNQGSFKDGSLLFRRHRASVLTRPTIDEGVTAALIDP